MSPAPRRSPAAFAYVGAAQDAAVAKIPARMSRREGAWSFLIICLRFSYCLFARCRSERFWVRSRPFTDRSNRDAYDGALRCLPRKGNLLSAVRYLCLTCAGTMPFTTRCAKSMFTMTRFGERDSAESVNRLGKTCCEIVTIRFDAAIGTRFADFFPGSSSCYFHNIRKVHSVATARGPSNRVNSQVRAE